MERTNRLKLPEFWWDRWRRARADERKKQADLFNIYDDAIHKIRWTTRPPLYPRVYEFSSDLFNKTEERIENVEARASSMLVAISAVVALLAGIWAFLGPDFIKLRPGLGPTAFCAGLGTCLLSAFCLTASLICACRVFGNFEKYVQGPEDLIPCGHEDEGTYSFRFGCKLLEYATKNYKVYNGKLAWLFCSQSCLQTGLVLALFTGIILGSAVVRARAGPGGTPGTVSVPEIRTERQPTKDSGAHTPLVQQNPNALGAPTGPKK